MAIKNEAKYDPVSALETLKVSLGWKEIENILNENILDLQSRLSGNEGDLVDLNEVNRLQDRLQDRKRLLKLPDLLILSYQEVPTIEGMKKKLDPFD